VNVTLWGTRGSVAAAGHDTVRYGGDTACVQVEGPEGEVIVLDAGSGVRPVSNVVADASRIDVLLTHLHMDHIQGLGFFTPLFDPGVETHIWGPPSATLNLGERLSRYLSPPLFPVHLRELPNTVLHDVDREAFQVGSVAVSAELVCHPGATLGYRLEAVGSTLAYLPDHEPALGVIDFPDAPEWTSGNALMAGADLVIHDAQYTDAEYGSRIGWGHSTLGQVVALAARAQVGTLVSFHHDPSHSDVMIDEMNSEVAAADLPFEFVPGRAGEVFRLG
jgi:phosphoribosyl 1,2-cyclic phosphodiesterase